MSEEPVNVQAVVQQAIDEYMRQDVARREPAYKTELQEERRRREQLEKRVNELVEENKRSRAVAEEAQRSTNIRTELQKLGVTKVDLAYKAVQDGIVRAEDGTVFLGVPSQLTFQIFGPQSSPTVESSQVKNALISRSSPSTIWCACSESGPYLCPTTSLAESETVSRSVVAPCPSFSPAISACAKSSS